MPLADDRAGRFAAWGRERTVWRRGADPTVIVLHERPGPHPLGLTVADRPELA